MPGGVSGQSRNYFGALFSQMSDALTTYSGQVQVVTANVVIAGASVSGSGGQTLRVPAEGFERERGQWHSHC